MVAATASVVEPGAGRMPIAITRKTKPTSRVSLMALRNRITRQRTHQRERPRDVGPDDQHDHRTTMPTSTRVCTMDWL
jgi:hypothetical protein